ncbi:disulfide bond formation protein DsbB [Vibrio rumoiensis]|uniref:disulfide bond formation protein DsbB n=1 Tax=Vibrio rumoiensis TaxID=76258 RepID=UPI0002DEBC48|nr:disulfide bond formation protein DsbB [Vibrio rumoiensis]
MAWLSSIHSFSQKRVSWLLLLLVVAFFEFSALYFQHVLMLAPCVMCVYERVAMMGMGVAATIGLIQPSNKMIRWLGLAGWGYTAFRGLQLALEHVGYQFNPSPFATCDIFPQFPSWAPLNQWVPWMFEPTGDCSKIVWQFLSLSMPQWLVIIFSANLIALTIIVISQFFKTK